MRLWCGQDDGCTPLLIASQEGRDVAVRTLLASGANVNQGRTVGVVGVDISMLRYAVRGAMAWVVYRSACSMRVCCGFWVM